MTFVQPLRPHPPANWLKNLWLCLRHHRLLFRQQLDHARCIVFQGCKYFVPHAKIRLVEMGFFFRARKGKRQTPEILLGHGASASAAFIKAMASALFHSAGPSSRPISPPLRSMRRVTGRPKACKALSDVVVSSM